MGVFLFSTKQLSTERVDDVLRSRGHQGVKIETSENSILVHAEKISKPRENYLDGKELGCEGDFIIGVGTFFYNGETGKKALRNIYNNIEYIVNDNRVYGHWAFCIRKGDTTYVLNDMSAMMRLYWHQDRDGFTISTSLLAVIASIDNPKFDKVRLSGVIMARYGSGVPFIEGVELVRPGYFVVITDNCIEWKRREQTVVRQIDNTDEAIDYLSSLFDEQITQLNTLKSDQVGVELSAGLDSRLIASVIKRGGLNYNFVHHPLYGPDKEVAYQVANGIGKDIYLQSDSEKLRPCDFAQYYGEFDFCYNFF